MANLLEISTIARSNDLKDMMVVLFESENEKDFILANNRNIAAETLVIRVKERTQLIGELDNRLGSIIAFESAKFLREINEADLAKARAFMTVISYIQIKVLKNISFLVQMHSKPTLAEYQSKWWTSTIDFLQVDIPRTLIRKPDLFYAYQQKVSAGRKRNRFCRNISTSISNIRRSKITSHKDHIIKELNSRIFKLEAIIQILGRERNGGVVDKSEFSDEFFHLSVEFCDELNHDFLELFESAICNSVGTPLDVDTKEEFDETHDYLLEKEFRMRL
uniref:Phospholipase-like protein n=1 Tax=Tanacetum cinerariifolium TaxID=118510 RepID=A0A6L2MCW6_TANCI|nr:phospholipase-like protein [Tanacetum cinerariifolium]